MSHDALEAKIEKQYGCEGAGFKAKGLTDAQVVQGQTMFGLNQLTPPPEKSECVKCLETQKGFFNILLWAGSILCFISYGIDSSAPDNLYLGIVLAFVVIATGVFEYFQEKSSSDLMKKFANMQPPQVTVTRNGESTQIPAAQLTHVSLRHGSLQAIFFFLFFSFHKIKTKKLKCVYLRFFYVLYFLLWMFC